MALSAKEAQNHLPAWLHYVVQGEDIKIRSDDESISYRLVMLTRKAAERLADLHPDALVMSDDCDEEEPGGRIANLPDLRRKHKLVLRAPFNEFSLL